MARIEGELAQLEQVMSEPDFWDDPDKAQRISREASAMKDRIEGWRALDQGLQDVEVLIELAVEEGDETTFAEAAEELKALQRRVEQMELEALLSGEYDGSNAIVDIHPGAGGTEAQDWAQMLLRMYTRWAEDRGYKVEVLDLLPGEEAASSGPR